MPFIPPREVKFSLFFFKSLSGIGIGIIGMLVLLVFVLLGLDTLGSEAVTGPFLTFAAVVMGFITALATNCLGIFLFGALDREKYADIHGVMKHVVSLNILIFIFLLPIYFLAIVGSDQNLKTILLFATVQLVVSALASMFALELSNSQSSRQNLIAVYGIIFAVLMTIVVNMLIYNLGQNLSTAAELAVGGSGGKGITIVLFSILPTTWFFFGAFTTMVEMVYRWIYQTWGKDPLSEQ
ncbi:MAG: hypothetical protein V1936_04060 [Patescibacteria group bacterium]